MRPARPPTPTSTTPRGSPTLRGGGGGPGSGRMPPSFPSELPPKYWGQGSSPPIPTPPGCYPEGASVGPLLACYSAFSQGLGQGASRTRSPSGVGVVGQPVEATPSKREVVSRWPIKRGGQQAANKLYLAPYPSAGLFPGVWEVGGEPSMTGLGPPLLSPL